LDKVWLVGLSVNERVYEIEKRGFEAADKLVAVSQFTKNIVTQHYGVAAEKIAVVHNGVGKSVPPGGQLALALKAKAAGRKIVLFVGRVTLQKGPDYFVEAAARVLAQEPQTIFIMAGDGDMLPATIRAVVGRGLAGNFFFPGFLRGAELEQIYRAADLFIMPSVSEPFGITPLESLQAGTPVIVSKQSGVAETLAHALKVDFWDTEELANKIIAALRYPSLHKQLATYGQQEAQNLTWGRAAQKLLPIYRSLLS
jgi:glycosyltransferase involved in cell wall biosynthesis